MKGKEGLVSGRTGQDQRSHWIEDGRAAATTKRSALLSVSFYSPALLSPSFHSHFRLLVPEKGPLLLLLLFSPSTCRHRRLPSLPIYSSRPLNEKGVIENIGSSPLFPTPPLHLSSHAVCQPPPPPPPPPPTLQPPSHFATNTAIGSCAYFLFFSFVFSFLHLLTGVCVMSWSTNCPHCIIMREYRT